MASAPATVQYRLPSKGNLSKIKVPRAGMSEQFLKWTQDKAPKTATQERQEAADRLKRTRPLAALTKKNVNSFHSRDMERLGDTPSVGLPVGQKEVTSMQQLGRPIRNAKGVETGKFEWNRGENVFAVRPAITGLNGRPGKRPARNSAELPAWKRQAAEYNGALSRQQMMNPDNSVLAARKGIRVSTKDIPEMPVVKMYASRGGNLGTNTEFANRLPIAAKSSTQIV